MTRRSRTRRSETASPILPSFDEPQAARSGRTSLVVGSWYARAVSEQRWVRSQRATVVDIGDEVVLVGRDGQIFKLADDSADLARAVIGFLGQARSEREVIAHLEAVSGEPLGERVRVVRELLALLSET